MDDGQIGIQIETIKYAVNDCGWFTEQIWQEKAVKEPQSNSPIIYTACFHKPYRIWLNPVKWEQKLPYEIPEKGFLLLFSKYMASPSGLTRVCNCANGCMKMSLQINESKSFQHSFSPHRIISNQIEIYISFQQCMTLTFFRGSYAFGHRFTTDNDALWGIKRCLWWWIVDQTRVLVCLQEFWSCPGILLAWLTTTGNPLRIWYQLYWMLHIDTTWR